VLTNSAHDTGVVSERKKGDCTKELVVQFSLSNGWNRALAEILSPFRLLLKLMPMWSRSVRGKSWSMCEVLCATPSAWSDEPRCCHSFVSAIEWHGLGGAIAAHETSRSSLCVYHSMHLVETRLMIELDFYMFFSMELPTKFWKTLCSLAEFIKFGIWVTDIKNINGSWCNVCQTHIILFYI